jgi:ribosomal protein S18 acetylase RimI-like enzyme
VNEQRGDAPRDVLARADGIVLRVVAGDDPVIRAVETLCYETLHRPFGVTRDDGWNEMDPRSTHLAALDGDCLAGYARLLGEGKTAHVRQVVVEPAYRRRGIASQLVGTLVERAAHSGFDAVYLNARPAAVAMYERFGFRVVGERFRMGRTYLPHVRMERPLR